jgi:hypothetical protein
MGNVLTNRSSSIVCDIATLGSFLACGAVSGFLFAALVTRPYLQEFFFIKADKFLIPRYSYWFAFSLLQLFGLIGDWEINFSPGPTILEELVQASRSCLGAVMLLTRDDELAGNSALAVPRDNVIFEMGMFMEAKGRERVLVVLEEGAKLPADIGGGIYLSLKDRSDISPIHSGLLSFIRSRI